ncbi:MAG: IS200/IS605 family transposase [Armatimonadetes bacterium]|nr:IS200/IS605 family transposase [Armatimonadota bacterium]
MSTYLSLNVHIVFSTKNRNPYLQGELQTRAHEYMGGTVRGLGAIPLEIGGVEDHVHLLLRIKATHSISNLVQEIKKASTNRLQEDVRDFAWQGGYAALSDGYSEIAEVTKYIQNQVEHHRKMTFAEERLEILKLAGIEYDPRFLD